MSSVAQICLETGYLLLWLFAIQLLALGVLPLTVRLFPRAPDAGYGFSKLFGLLLFAYLCWLIGISGFLALSTLTVAGAFFVLCCVPLLLPGIAWPGFRRFFKQYRSPIISIELLFLSCFVGYALISSFKPEIYWGEKPMDFSFLNYFTRVETLPPDDPWAAGQKMQYYYFGFLMFGSLIRFLGIPAGIGYNLAVVTVAALYVMGCYAFLLCVTRHRSFSLIGSLAVALFSNLQGIYLVLFAGRRLDFDQYFWPTTRLFTSPAFAEYPLWSFLFADLHPHYMALPFTVLLLGICSGIISTAGNNWARWVAKRLAVAFVLGSLLVLNTWDLISYGLVVALFILLRPMTISKRPAKKVLSYLATGFSRVGEGLIIGALALAFFYPHFAASQHRLHYGWIATPEFNSFFHFLMHWGQWWLPVLLGLLALLLYRPVNRTDVRFFPAMLAGFLAALPVLVLSIISSQHNPGLSWLWVGVLAFLSAASTFLFILQSNSLLLRQLVILILAAAWLLTGSEVLFLMDRANTIFKFSVAVWTLLGLSAAVIAFEV